MKTLAKTTLILPRRSPIWSTGHRRARGFTLVELVVALAVGSIIALAVITSITQVLNGSARSSNHMSAIRQVQNAGYWVSRDAAMAHSTNVTTVSPDFLVFTWTGWDDRQNKVRYVMEDAPGGLKNLRRIQQVVDNVTGNWRDIGSSLAGQYIVPESTSRSFAPGNMTFTVTAKVGSGARTSTETRTYEVKPRPGQ
jgi:prepilin-type N-terminal cleavage/methylation domain-containing protein